MATSLSNVVDNLTAGIQKIMCRDCEFFLEYETIQQNINIHLAVKITQTKFTKN